jgi:membrane peptidoglycan carboxypeptidase
VRKALQYSLNLPAIRALERVGNEAVADTSADFGIRFQNGRIQFLQSGLAGALGTVEVTPLDLTAAYGAIANGGRLNPPRLVLRVIGPEGNVVYRAPAPKPKQVVSRAAAYLVTDIIAGNTDPRQNPIWADVLELRNGPKGERRPAAAKTGTTNDTRDLATYGYLAPPEDSKAPAIAVGVWMGNSDHSYPRGKNPPISLQGPAPLWQAFVREWTKGKPIAKFEPPKGVVRAEIDAWSGGQRGPWTRESTSEWFMAGTEPGAKGAVDEPGLLYTNSCGFWTVDPLKAELGPATWDRWVADWMARARRGVGVQGELQSRTAYFWGRTGWGGPVGTCSAGVRGLGLRPYNPVRRQPVRNAERPNPGAGQPAPGASAAPGDSGPNVDAGGAGDTGNGGGKQDKGGKKGNGSKGDT